MKILSIMKYGSKKIIWRPSKLKLGKALTGEIGKLRSET